MYSTFQGQVILLFTCAILKHFQYSRVVWVGSYSTSCSTKKCFRIANISIDYVRVNTLTSSLTTHVVAMLSCILSARSLLFIVCNVVLVTTTTLSLLHQNFCFVF